MEWVNHCKMPYKENQPNNMQNIEDRLDEIAEGDEDGVTAVQVWVNDVGNVRSELMSRYIVDREAKS